MAEHKACADVVADAGEDNSSSSVSQGECALMTPASLLRSQSSQSSGVDDSGTESGDDFRLLSPEILAEVQSALVRLESALPGLDPVRRESLVQLVNRLQHCLKLQTPNAISHSSSKRFANKRLLHQKRHTVGVSKEELADARRWLLETGLQENTDNAVSEPHKIQRQKSASNIDDIEQDAFESEPVVSKVFRPMKFVPSSTDSSLSTYVPENSVEVKHELVHSKNDTEDRFHKPVIHRLSLDFVDEPPKLSGSLSYNNQHREVENGSSLLEYDPSLVLFTPAQSVQIAVHKAAINKQISQEESKRRGEESDDEGDISSTEEEPTLVASEKRELIMSAQSTGPAVTDTAKKVTTPIRFHNRNSKKLKMKRANTIDIPKPIQFCDADGSSGDEYDRASADELSKNHNYLGNTMYSNDNKLHQPTFEPKTENDMKFLAFLQQAKHNSNPKTTTYNPSARGGPQWTSRFTNIKTAFEMPSPKQPIHTPKSKPFPSSSPQWQDNVKHEPPPFRQSALNRSPQPLQCKLPWKAKEEDGVVIGSLTVSKTPIGAINQFSHASKSAFKPIDKKPMQKFQSIPSPTGTNKQFDDHRYYENSAANSILKQYPPVHDKEFSVPLNKALIQNVPKNPSNPITNSNSIVSNNHQKELDGSNNLPHDEYPHYNYTESPVAHQQMSSPPHNNTNQYSDHSGNVEDNQQSYISFPYSIVENSCLRPSSEPYLEQNSQHFSGQSQNYFSSDSEQYIKNEVSTNIIQPTTPLGQTVILKIPLVGDTPLSKDHTPQAKADNGIPSNDYGYDLLTHNVQTLNNSDSKDSVQYLGSNNSISTNHSSISSVSSHKQCDTSPYQFDDSADSVSESPVLWVKGKEENKITSPDEVLEEQTAITRVMGRPQCQQAVTISNRTQHRYDNDVAAAKKLESELRLCVSSKSALKANAISPTNISSHNSSNIFQTKPTNVSLKIPLSVASGVTHSEKITKNITSGMSENFSKKIHTDVPPHSVNVKKLASKMSNINPSSNIVRKNAVGTAHSGSHAAMKRAVYHQPEPVNTSSVKKSPNLKPPSILRSPPGITVSKSPLNSASPTFPNVLQKSESWHQMVKEQNTPNVRLAPPQSPRLSKTKSSHNLAFPKQFEAVLSADAVSVKQTTVDYYLNKQTKVKKKEHTSKTTEKKSSVSIIKLDDDLDNVDEAFESLFVESSKKKK